jgi:hypothetical protein
LNCRVCGTGFAPPTEDALRGTTLCERCRREVDPMRMRFSDEQAERIRAAGFSGGIVIEVPPDGREGLPPIGAWAQHKDDPATMFLVMPVGLLVFVTIANAPARGCALHFVPMDPFDRDEFLREAIKL